MVAWKPEVHFTKLAKSRVPGSAAQYRSMVRRKNKYLATLDHAIPVRSFSFVLKNRKQMRYCLQGKPKK